MPVYNTEKYLRRAIESVLQQIDVNIHLALVDDASTDGSFEVINQYKDRDNVSVFKNTENRGVCYSRNRGMELLKKGDFDFFTVHDSDDMSDITRYKKVLDEFDKDVNIIGIQTGYIRLDEKYITDELDLTHATYESAGEGIAIYRKWVFDEVGYYDNTRFSGDTEYWWRVKMFCSINTQYKLSFFGTPQYIAIRRNDSLTNVHRSRNAYFKKMFDDIKQMKIANNFWRDKFN